MDIVAAMKSEWAERVREAMRASGLSLNAISRQSGVGYSCVHRFAHGVGTIQIETAERLGKVVGLDLRPVEADKPVKPGGKRRP